MESTSGAIQQGNGYKSDPEAVPHQPDPNETRRDHKDSLNRYLMIKGDDQGKDHYVQPDDGKLVVLRVQKAQKPLYPLPTGIPTTWELPLSTNGPKG
jgi:hypothetical protein